MFVSKVVWAGLVLSIFMLCSGVWLLYVPPYAGAGSFIVFSGLTTLALVLASNIAATRLQNWIDNARTVETALALLERKSGETSQPQITEEEFFEEIPA